MLTELSWLDGIFGCLKASNDPTASQARKVPDDSNALFGAQRNLKELNVSPDTRELL
jgi:hypothetical protein